MHEGNPVLNMQIGDNGVYIYLLIVPNFSSRYLNNIKRTSRLGRLLALSLEILSGYDNHCGTLRIELSSYYSNYTCSLIRTSIVATIVLLEINNGSEHRYSSGLSNSLI